MDYESLNIKPETKKRLMQHKQHKRDTQDDVVNHVLDMVEGETQTDYNDEQLAEIQQQLERIDSALGDTVAKSLEIGDSRNPVELEATEYSKIANEVVGKLK